MWYWYKNTRTDQWNRRDTQESNTHTYGQLIFDKGGKNIQWRKKRNLLSKWYWESWTAICKLLQLEHMLTPHVGKKRSKWVGDLCLVSQSCLTHAWQAPLSMGFPRQEYCSGLPFPSPVDLLNPGIEPSSPALVGRFFNH